MVSRGGVRNRLAAGEATHSRDHRHCRVSLLRRHGWCLFPPPPQLHPGIFEVTAIDVGQGDSLLLITPEGKTLLLDAGGMTGTALSDFDVGEEVVSPYLWSRGIRHLDAVALSHAHTDHIGGMRSVIANFQPREFWYGVESPSAGFLNVEQRARDCDGKLTPVFGGRSLRLWRRSRAGAESAGRTGRRHDPPQDDESLVLRMQYGATSALLVGDSHRRIEKFLLQENPQADLLKIGHHGSFTSSSPEFLEAVKPRFAVVSVGFYNCVRASATGGDAALRRCARYHLPHRPRGRRFVLIWMARM